MPSRSHCSVLVLLLYAPLTAAAAHQDRSVFRADVTLVHVDAGIVERTGGDAVPAGDSGTSFADMMRRIRSRYSLYYAMTKGIPGAVRSVRVELSSQRLGEFPQALVRTRKGYIVPNGRGASDPVGREHPNAS